MLGYAGEGLDDLEELSVEFSVAIGVRYFRQATSRAKAPAQSGASVRGAHSFPVYREAGCSSFNQAQQTMHQRVAEAYADKSARERLQEEAETSTRTIKKLKERQEALAVAGSDNVTAVEYQMREERDKLLVRRWTLSCGIP